jgi:hypothetical protein
VQRRRLSVYFLYLAWRVWKSVVTLAVTRNTNSCRVIRRYRVTVFKWQRLPMTGSRWNIRWVSGREMTPTFFVFPLFSVTGREKCYDACGDGESHLRLGFLAFRGDVFSVASNAVDRKSIGHTVGERSWNDADVQCISCT